MKLTLDRDLCCGCYACHIACMDAHFSPGDRDAVSFRHTEILCKPEDSFQKAICTGCLHCDPAPCMLACPAGAIYREPTFGLVLIARDSCIGCRQCMSACPEHAISASTGGTARKCDGCIELLKAGGEPACVRVCFMRAIRLE